MNKADFGLGYRPDTGDHRDKKFTVAFAAPEAELPPAIDLRSKMPAVRNQGALGSCVGHGVRAAMLFVNLKKGEKVDLSPLFIYWNGRAIEGTTNRDSGLMIRDGIKAVAKFGACQEADWPYIIAKFRNKPLDKAYDGGKVDAALSYYRVDNRNVNELRLALASGFPIVFGATVYNAIYNVSKKNNVLPMPHANDRPIGGHCMALCGYSIEHNQFLAQNSWGTSWGDGGFFLIPADYLTNDDITSDCWVINKTN